MSKRDQCIWFLQNVHSRYDIDSWTPLFIRVLIPAVYKNTINPKLDVFNNCFDDEFSTRKWTMEAYYDCCTVNQINLCSNFLPFNIATIADSRYQYLGTSHWLYAPVLNHDLGMHNHSRAYCMRLDPCCDISTLGDTCDRVVHCCIWD